MLHLYVTLTMYEITEDNVLRLITSEANAAEGNTRKKELTYIN